MPPPPPLQLAAATAARTVADQPISGDRRQDAARRPGHTGPPWRRHDSAEGEPARLPQSGSSPARELSSPPAAARRWMIRGISVGYISWCSQCFLAGVGGAHAAGSGGTGSAGHADEAAGPGGGRPVRALSPRPNPVTSAEATQDTRERNQREPSSHSTAQHPSKGRRQRPLCSAYSLCAGHRASFPL